jgi:TetR/AcrR family transcriptional regulator, transcriptional repressor for nem operon
MPRPREFDEQIVLDAATDRFWMNGYEATSVRDVAEQMGLTSASLYNAFGDKRALYRRVLDRYAKATLMNCANAFDGKVPPKRAIKEFFDATVAKLLNDAQHKGCLVVNTSLEVAPHDEEFRDVVKNVFVRIEKYLRDCIKTGQADGTISTKHSAADLARSFLGAVLGLRVLARTRPERELLTGLVRPLLSLLDP